MPLKFFFLLGMWSSLKKHVFFFPLLLVMTWKTNIWMFEKKKNNNICMLVHCKFNFLKKYTKHNSTSYCTTNGSNSPWYRIPNGWSHSVLSCCFCWSKICLEYVKTMIPQHMTLFRTSLFHHPPGNHTKSYIAIVIF